MKKVIAIFALAGSGKTTAALSFSSAEVLSFASTYKEISLLLGFNMQRKDEADPIFGISPREFLQSFGDFCRYQMPEKFGKRWLGGEKVSLSSFLMRERIKSSKAETVIIDDLRYVEEFEMLRKTFDVKLVHIRAEFAPLLQINHSSEREYEEIKQAAVKSGVVCWNIVNGGTLEEYRAMMKRVFAWLK